VNGQKGQFGQTNYATAKAGIHGFTMSLARKVATKGITVCRLAEASEIASVVAWLCGDESGLATGAFVLSWDE
jgi:acetoacetyl-CoA reductase